MYVCMYVYMCVYVCVYICTLSPVETACISFQGPAAERITKIAYDEGSIKAI
jgi:hypothetical protein